MNDYMANKGKSEGALTGTEMKKKKKKAQKTPSLSRSTGAGRRR